MARDQVFISYSHKDKKWRDDLDTHLKPSLRDGSIISWSDEQISPASQWFTEIKTALTNTKVAVLLVTPDFLASDFIHEHELGPLLKEAKQGGIKILWVPVRASSYKKTALKDYQAVLDPDKPLASMTKAKRDEAWLKICEEIEKAATLVSPPQSAPIAVPVKGRGRREVVGFTAHKLAELYDFPTEFDGRGQCIGLIELGGGYRDSDLEVYFKELKLPVPKLTTISSGGAKNNPDPTGSPVTLEIEICGAIAPGAEMVIYFAPNTNKGFQDALQMAIHDEVHRPSVLSVTWGAPESVWNRQALHAIDSALQSAAEKEITVCCAAGDGGVSDGLQDGLHHVDFPASSPYALACGGTSLTTSGKTIAAEVVWNDPGRGATGGGLSSVFQLPAWQTNVGASFRSVGRIGRALPDVAAHASPSLGYRMFVDGRWVLLGGTAAVTPLWAGLIALLNQGAGRRVGYINPTLYRQFGPAGVLRSVESGDNGSDGLAGYSAGPGWNACTGWGSPNGKNLLLALRLQRLFAAYS